MAELPLIPTDVRISGHPECTLCPLREQGAGVPLHVGIGTFYLPTSLPPGEGPVVVYVGRNPGFHEDQCGQPFVGRSGQILRSSYLKGIRAEERASVYLTNLVRCYTVKNAKPKQSEVKACRPYLHQDLQRILPLSRGVPILVLLGQQAAEGVIRLLRGDSKPVPQRKAFQLNGTTYDFPLSEGGGTLRVATVATYHPAYVARDWDAIKTVHRHNDILSRILDGRISIPESTPRVVRPRLPSPAR